MSSIQVIAARGILINSKNQILMVSQNGINWHLPGGWIETMENLLKGCEREVLEETGFKVEATKVILIAEMLQNPTRPEHKKKQKFDCFCVCNIIGNQEIRDNWIDHDNDVIKYCKFINNNEWMDNQAMQAPQSIKKIPIENLHKMQNCYEYIGFTE